MHAPSMCVSSWSPSVRGRSNPLQPLSLAMATNATDTLVKTALLIHGTPSAQQCKVYIKRSHRIHGMLQTLDIHLQCRVLSMHLRIDNNWVKRPEAVAEDFSEACTVCTVSPRSRQLGVGSGLVRPSFRPILAPLFSPWSLG
jgi:hypothetical protein